MKIKGERVRIKRFYRARVTGRHEEVKESDREERTKIITRKYEEKDEETRAGKEQKNGGMMSDG